MKIKTTLGLSWAFFSLRFKPSGCGKYAPGKLALQFDKDIYKNLAKNYEIVEYWNQRENPDNCSLSAF